MARTPETGRKEPMTLARAQELRKDAVAMRRMALPISGPLGAAWVESCDKRIANLDAIIARLTSRLPGVLMGFQLDQLETGNDPSVRAGA